MRVAFTRRTSGAPSHSGGMTTRSDAHPITSVFFVSRGVGLDGCTLSPALRLTDLAVSCKAARCITQPAGPGARRRPGTHSRTERTEGQDAVRAALTAAPPSWAAFSTVSVVRAGQVIGFDEQAFEQWGDPLFKDAYRLAKAAGAGELEQPP